jgi:hypothetical protein
MRKLRQGVVITGLVSVALLGAILLPSCGADDENIPLSDDEVLCIYGAGGEDGFGLKEGPILPGQNASVKQREDRPVVRIPLSNRFYEVSKGPGRDAGAATHIKVFDKDGIPVHVQAKVHFVFNAQAACDWFDAHGARNSKTGAQYCSPNGDNCVQLGKYDMGFNARGGIVTPWINSLNEQYGQVLDDVANVTVDDYGWEEMAFDEDVMVTESETEVAKPVRTVIEEQLTARFSAQFNDEYGDVESDRKFFCGTNHNQANPNACPDMRVQILDIQPEDEKLTQQITSLANKKESDRLLLEDQRRDAEFQKQARENEKAKTEQDRTYEADKAEQDRIYAADKAERDRLAAEALADEQDKLLDLKERQAQQEIRDAAIANEKAAKIAADKRASEEANGVFEDQLQDAQLQGAKDMAWCIAPEPDIVGLDCVFLISIQKGIPLPPHVGATYNIPTAVQPAG